MLASLTSDPAQVGQCTINPLSVAARVDGGTLNVSWDISDR